MRHCDLAVLDRRPKGKFSWCFETCVNGDGVKIILCWTFGDGIVEFVSSHSGQHSSLTITKRKEITLIEYVDNVEWLKLFQSLSVKRFQSGGWGHSRDSNASQILTVVFTLHKRKNHSRSNWTGSILSPKDCFVPAILAFARRKRFETVRKSYTRTGLLDVVVVKPFHLNGVPFVDHLRPLVVFQFCFLCESQK